MRTLAAVALALLSMPAFAQDLLAGIDPHVLQGLLSPGDQSLVISRTVPAEFAAVRMPRELQLIGGAERSLGAGGPGAPVAVSVGYKTSGTPEAAAKLAVDALVARGGVPQAQMPTPGYGVFVFSVMTPQQTICLGELPVTLVTNAMDGTTYVVLSTQRGTTNAACNGRMRPMPPAAMMDPDLPKLQMPADPATGRPAQVSGSSGGSSQNGSTRASVRFLSQDSPANVAAHFARQLQEQGWSQDTAWNGTVTAGSQWSKARAGKPALTAALRVAATAEGLRTAILNISAR